MAYPVKMIVIGAGSRGEGYTHYAAQHPDLAQIVAVADPLDFQRNVVGDAHNIPEERRFRTWEDVAKLPKFADAVLICTQDNLHEAPAIAFAKLGYNILLEKPMAPSAESCRRIVAAVKEAGVLFAVCHVLRYTAYTQKVKQLIQSGAIGEIVSIQHLEPVGYWHQAHSFVRGNWRNEAESSFMLLAKSCHDVDWLRYVMDCSCKRVHSFGSLNFFRKEKQPKGASDRCWDCPSCIEKDCPYSAFKIYLRDRLDKGHSQWPVDVLTDKVTRETVLEAIKNGPYGRCAFACDNDVVDNQVINFEFEGNRTCSMTMTAFDQHTGRRTRIFGTRGSIDTDSEIIHLYNFETNTMTDIDTNIKNDGGILSGHGGGDEGLIASFTKAVAENNKDYILSGPDDTLESHLIVFAAERSRRAGTIEEIK